MHSKIPNIKNAIAILKRQLHCGMIVPKEFYKIKDQAEKKIFNALNQVHDSVHFNQHCQQTMETLYVGNLDNKSDTSY